MDVYTLKLDKKNAIPREGAVIARSDDDRTALRFDYTLGRFTRLGFRARTDESDTAVAAHVSVPGLSLAVKLENKWLRKLGDHELAASLDWSEGELWAHWAPAVRDWSCVSFGELLFGELLQDPVVRATYTTELLLPEGRYPCVVSLTDVTTWRARAPELTRRTLHTADVKFVTPPGFPGKGESPHDLGDDWLNDVYLPGVESASDALAQIYARVMRLRETRGGLGWTPPWKPAALGGIAHQVELPEVVAPDVEAATRLLNGASIRAYCSRGVGLLVVALATRPDAGVLSKVGDRLLSIAAAIPGASDLHVAFVVAPGVRDIFNPNSGTFTPQPGPGARLYELHDETLIPFDPKIWPGSVAVFL